MRGRCAPIASDPESNATKVEPVARPRPAHAGAARQAFDRRAAVPEHERRSGAGILHRRHGRGHHHRPVALSLAVRDRAQFHLRLQGQSTDVNQVGRELGVRYVLEGSVRKAGERLRITGQLIEAGTGAHVWAERYDRASTTSSPSRTRSPGVWFQRWNRNSTPRKTCACENGRPRASTLGAVSSAPCPYSRDVDCRGARRRNRLAQACSRDRARIRPRHEFACVGVCFKVTTWRRGSVCNA